MAGGINGEQTGRQVQLPANGNYGKEPPFFPLVGPLETRPERVEEIL